MKRLSKEKRNQLVIVILATLGVLALIGFGLIRPQYQTLSKIRNTRDAADKQLRGIKQSITNSEAIAIASDETNNALSQAEADMASGDLYSWTYDTIRRFKQAYRVDIPEVGHPTVGDSDLLAAFPYKQMRFVINGSVYYHDLGKFVADFENNFPHSRLVRLIVEPGGIKDSKDNNSEKLSFKMEVVTLVKPNPI